MVAPWCGKVEVMSGNESVDSLLNHDVLAFEYVTGVMRGEERVLFERLLHTNENLANQVGFWEEQLMQLSDEHEQRPLEPEVWLQIKSRLTSSQSRLTSSKSRFTASPHNLTQIPAAHFTWPRWLAWAMPSVAVLILAGVLLLVVPQKTSIGPNADYVAVLTDAKGAARLTVLTATKGTALWLKWEPFKVAPDKNVQLWAISKRDGQIRPLGVFAQTDISQLALSTASWRLIKDAELLMLTEEDVGGSAVDEPSDVILAKGVCVLLAKIENSI
jgi:anti-sigma-K factor RskA